MNDYRISETEVAFSYYCGFIHEKLNYKLRHGCYQNNLNLTLFDKYINLMSEEIDKRKMHNNIIAIRWMKYKIFKNIYKTNPFKLLFNNIQLIDNGFLSTSLNSYYIHSDGNKVQDSVLIFIQIPSGIKSMYMYKRISDRDEYELLLPPKTILQVNKVYLWGLKRAIIITKAIPN